jgi:hypothetical protein
MQRVPSCATNAIKLLYTNIHLLARACIFLRIYEHFTADDQLRARTSPSGTLKRFRILPTGCIYTFRMILTMNTFYSPKQY